MTARVIAIPLILSAAASLIYLAIPCGTCRGEIWEETLWDAEKCRFDYCGNYHAARAGDFEALQRLFEFSKKTDAASALGHGCALMRILESIGDEPFSRCIRRQALEMRRLIGNFLEVGVEYKLGLLPDDMAHLFPLCHQSAFEGTTERLYR